VLTLIRDCGPSVGSGGGWAEAKSSAADPQGGRFLDATEITSGTDRDDVMLLRHHGHLASVTIIDF